MSGAEKRQVIDLAEAQRLWAAHLDSRAGQDRAVHSAVTATLRRFLSSLTVSDEPRRLAFDKRSLWLWLTDDAKGRSVRYVATRLAIVNDFLQTLVEAGLVDANPLTEFRPCYGQPSWRRLARALQSNNPEATVASLQTAPPHAGPLDACIRAYLDLHRSLGKKFLGPRDRTPLPRPLSASQRRTVASGHRPDDHRTMADGACRERLHAGRKAQILHRFFDYLRSESIVAQNLVAATNRLPGSSFKPFIFTKGQLAAVLEAAQRMPDRCCAPVYVFHHAGAAGRLGTPPGRGSQAALPRC